MSTVPVIDISPFLEGNPDDRRRVARLLDEACSEVGFFFLAGHGVSDAQFAEIYDVSKAFFHLDVAEKRKVGQPRPDVVRGYIGFGAGALADTLGESTPPDLKESFSAGPVDVPSDDPYFASPLVRDHFAPNRWPDDPAEFGSAWTRYYREMTRLADDMMRLAALALDLPEHHFADKSDRSIAILGAMYYPDQKVPPEPGQLRAGAHTDFGTFTILRPDEAPGGLQVLTKAGDWAPARAPRDTFVVNVGDLLARWTNDRWVSTLHRVVNPPADARLGSERLSIGYFHEANYDTVVECLPSCRSPDNPPKYAPITAGEHLYSQFSSQTRTAAPTDGAAAS